MAKVITFGEIMLPLATSGYLRFSQARQYEATFGGGEVNARAYVSRFNFSGADQEKLCGILSGGERNRLGNEEPKRFKYKKLMEE